MEKSIKIASLEEAINRFPFVEQLIEISRNFKPEPLFELFYTGIGGVTIELLEVRVEDWGDFISRMPYDEDDQRFSVQGWERWALYIVGKEDRLSKVNMRAGSRVIYPARNMVSPGYADDIPDDIDRPGETIGKAINRVEIPFEYAVLHHLSNTSSPDPNYNTAIISRKE